VRAVERRKERLEELVHRYGHEKVSAVPFDITKIDAIKAFAMNATGTHEDLDCIVLNSGIPGKIDFSELEEVDMDVVSEEFVTVISVNLPLPKNSSRSSRRSRPRPRWCIRRRGLQ
jgi:NADP-dependent 3-hydroxy acid dehydrogenase YdfG